jgi:hypothetical protein
MLPSKAGRCHHTTAAEKGSEDLEGSMTTAKELV